MYNTSLNYQIRTKEIEKQLLTETDEEKIKLLHQELQVCNFKIAQHLNNIFKGIKY